MSQDKPAATRSRRLPYRVRRLRPGARGSSRPDYPHDYPHSFREQLKRYSVALISLVVAIVSLGYNTWRNETSEIHRNWRQAAFTATVELNQLQQIVLYRRYFHGRQEHVLTPLRDAETWVTGWGKATSVRDLTSLLPEPLPEQGTQLFETWEANAGKLDSEGQSADEAEEALMQAIDEAREAILGLISRLS